LLLAPVLGIVVWVHSPYELAADVECTLRDGRRLAYAVWGDPDGETVFLFHGAPGSRLFAPDPVTTAEAGVRLVTVDRPGYGGSDRQAGRSILDWPIDLLQVADRLEVARFAVVGHSSGGPYALACALRMPDRISGVAVVSSVAPNDDRPPRDSDDDDLALTGLARKAPERAQAQIGQAAAWLVQDPDHFFDLPRPEPDGLLLTDPSIRSMYLRAVRESVKQGIDAYAWECVIERRPWDFALADIGTDVAIWHGGQDATVPPSAAAALAGALPHHHLRLVPEAAHGLILSAWADILNDLNH
jgi:pimeloyl-ACP methyl ester carboxylesterase